MKMQAQQKLECHDMKFPAEFSDVGVQPVIFLNPTALTSIIMFNNLGRRSISQVRPRIFSRYTLGVT
jgi:hypothetical protein